MRYVIIGGGIAGIRAADAIRRRDRTSEILVFSRDSHPLYARPRLPDFICGRVTEEKLFLFGPSWYSSREIKLSIGRSVEGIDVPDGRVILSDGGREAYDRLLIATGSSPFIPPVPGLSGDGVFTLRTISDARAIRDRASSSKSAAVLGGGLLGLEVAYRLKLLGLDVSVVEVFDRLLPRQIDPEGSIILRSELERLGLKFYLGQAVSGVERSSGKLILKLGDQGSIEGDMALVAAGVRPDIGLAKEAGIPTGRGITVDDRLGTGVEGIFAAGDVAEHRGRCIGIWPVAMEQGDIAGENMAGGELLYAGSVPFTILKVEQLDFGSVGEIPEDLEGVRVERSDAGGYSKVFIRDGRIIGAILLGNSGKLRQIQGLIRDKVDVSGYEDAILRDSFDLSKFGKGPM